MTSIGNELKGRGSLPPNIRVLDPGNIEPVDIATALIHCELNTVHFPSKIENKIINDLSLLEKSLEKELSSVINDVKFVCTVTNILPSGNEEKRSHKDKLLDNIQNLGKLLEEIKAHYEKFKEMFKTMDPILRMGGYRSLIICLLETVDSIAKKLARVRAQSYQISATEKM